MLLFVCGSSLPGKIKIGTQEGDAPPTGRWKQGGKCLER